MTQKLLGCCSKDKVEESASGAYSWGTQGFGVLAHLLLACSELEKYPASAMELAFSASHLQIIVFWPLGSAVPSGVAGLPMRNNLGSTQGTFTPEPPVGLAETWAATAIQGSLSA